MKLDQQPTVRKYLDSIERREPPTFLSGAELRGLAMDMGADDAGIVEVDRAGLTQQRIEILRHYPRTRTLLSFVVKFGQEVTRTMARSVSTLEFHHAGDRGYHRT